MISDTITLGNLIGYAALVGGFVGLGMNARKVRRENEADARSRTEELKTEFRLHDASTDERLTKVETRIADFMPRAEIEAKIEHEKNNRLSGQQALKASVDQNTRDVVDIKVAVGRLEQKQDGMSGELAEMKSLIKELGRDVNSKLDKQQECLNSISRRAG